MAIFNFPSIFPQTESLRYLSNTQVFESPLDKTVQTASLSGDQWSLSQSFVNLSRNNGSDLKAFLVSLKGPSGKAYITPYEAREPRGTVSGSPVVNGASQTGNSLVTSGWSVSQTVLKAGDYFEVNGEFKMVVSDVLSSGTGAATIQFEPALRASPLNSEPLITDNPKCIMRLANNDQAQWQLSQTKKYSVNLEWIEAF